MSSLADMLAGVRQPAAYAGGEINSVAKDPRSVLCRVALAYPDLYVIGMSYLGLQVLYRAVNDQPDLWAERVFAPAPDFERALRQSGRLLCSLESGTPLAGFDLVGFSAQHELNLVDILRMLRLGGVPLRAEQRGEEHPVVVMGGPGAAQPEPLAPALDAVFLGDGEEGLVEMARVVGRGRRAGWPRQRILDRLQEVAGVYLPGRYRPRFSARGEFLGMAVQAGAPAQVERRVLADLEKVAPPRPVLAACRPVHDRLSIEIQRGCGRGCRFCQAGMINRPVRQRSAAAVVQQARRLLAETGHDQLSLLSLSAGDHPQLLAMLGEFLRPGGDWPVAVSLPSLRAETLSGEMAELIRRVRKSGFTIAPEAGSERLRRAINKKLGEQDVLAAARAAFGAGWRLIKLYFMIGLPGEEDEDREQIVELVRKVREQARQVRASRINVGVSTFVPKAHTPFQWEAMLAPEQVQAVQKRLRRELAALGGVKVGWSQVRMSWLEGVLSRSDRRVFVALEKLALDGAGLLAWSEHFHWEVIRGAFEPLLAQIPDPLRQLDPGAPLPWEHLRLGPTKEFLLAERERARCGLPTPDCLAEACHDCGACAREITPRLAKDMPMESAAPRPAAEKRRFKVRLRLSKRETAVFLGHLDFVGQLARALRRAGWPLVYSQGHHPQPRLSFGPACPVGIESLAEWLDVELRGEGDWPEEEMRRRLVEQLPAGVQLEEMKLLRDDEPGIPRRAVGLRWRLFPPPGFDLQEAEKRWQSLRQTGGAAEIRGLASVTDLRLEQGTVVVEVSLQARALARPTELARLLFDSAASRIVKESLVFGEDLRH